MMRKCTKCGVSKPATAEFFYAEKRARSGLRSDCKDCLRATVLHRQHLHRDEHNARSRAWRKANPDIVRQQSARWRRKYPDKNKEIIKRWRVQNPEATKAAATRFAEAHPERIREAANRWRQTHREQVRVQWRTRAARRKGAIGNHTPADLAAIRQQQRNRCAYCRSVLRHDAHVDHIRALARGGSNSRENLQWLCAPCNLSKGAKDAVEFAQSRGLLV